MPRISERGPQLDSQLSAIYREDEVGAWSILPQCESTMARSATSCGAQQQQPPSSCERSTMWSLPPDRCHLFLYIRWNQVLDLRDPCDPRAIPAIAIHEQCLRSRSDPRDLHACLLPLQN
eukprot:scaffold861_cov123-Isochrysis_galbana.AAC.4